MANGLLSDRTFRIGYPGAGLLQEPVQYDPSLEPLGQAVTGIGKEMYRIMSLPGSAARGELGVPSVQNPYFVGAGQEFAIDYGMLPSLVQGAIAPAATSTLRMGLGGADTTAGGVRRMPEVDELGFYSKALETARMLPQEKGTGQQFRSMLTKAGVKEDEIKFTPGLEGLLSQPKVTRDELVGLLEESRIRPLETVKEAVDASSDSVRFSRQPELVRPEELGGGDYVLDEASRILDSIRTSEDFLYDDDLIDMMVNSGMEMPEAERVLSIYKKEGPGSDKLYSVDVQFVEDAASDLVRDRYYSTPDYQVFHYDDLEGLGYRVEEDASGFNVFDPQGRIVNRTDISSIDEAEVVALDDARRAGLINDAGETRFMEYTEPGGSNYREMLLQVPEYEGMTDEFIATGHFDEPNIVVHARTKDRNSETGVNDVLYVEELQSDWGQRGRNLGFDTPENKAKMEEIQKRGKELEQARDKANKERDQLIEGFANRVAKDIEDDAFYDPSMGHIYAADGSRLASFNDIMRYLEHGRPLEVLTTDFSKGFRKIIQPDEQLSKKYNELTRKWQDASQRYLDQADEYRSFKADIPVGPLVTNTKKFAEVGIKRLINQAVNEGKRYVSFTTGDLQAQRWNNPGLRTYYDDIIPKVAKTVVKRLDKDAKTDFMFIEDVADMGGNSGQTRFTIEITDKMREEALRGQPLFMRGSVPIPQSGLLSDQKEQMTMQEMARRGII